MKKKQSIIVIITGLLLFLLAYWRQTLFLIINALIAEQYYNYANTPPPFFLQDLSAATLYKLKWILTPAFSGGIFLVAATGLWLAFKNRTLIKSYLAFYALFFLLSFATYGLGKIAGQFDAFYFWSHSLAMVLQSPIPFFVAVTIAFYLSLKGKLKNS